MRVEHEGQAYELGLPDPAALATLDEFEDVETLASRLGAATEGERAALLAAAYFSEVKGYRPDPAAGEGLSAAVAVVRAMRGLLVSGMLDGNPWMASEAAAAVVDAIPPDAFMDSAAAVIGEAIRVEHARVRRLSGLHATLRRFIPHAG